MTVFNALSRRQLTEALKEQAQAELPQYRAIITIPQCYLEALLLSNESCPAGHRGVWFYDPMLYGDIAAGDRVLFVHDPRTPIIAGMVTGLVELDSADHGKWCTRINERGFYWNPV